MKETFATGYGGIFYRADEGDRCKTISGAIVPWKPSIFCTRKASRINLEILSVRVERLQDISEEDAIAEGIVDGGCVNCGNPEPCRCAEPSPDARDSFVFLWESINGAGSWGINPWVWAVSFKAVAHA